MYEYREEEKAKRVGLSLEAGRTNVFVDHSIGSRRMRTDPRQSTSGFTYSGLTPKNTRRI